MDIPGRVVDQTLGPVGLALVPFGSFFYVYADLLLADIDALPDEVLARLVLYSSDAAVLQSRLENIRLLGTALFVLGLALLSVYLLDYVRNTDSYAESYSKPVAVFGVVGALVWIGVVIWLGYSPAAESVREFVFIAQENPETAGEVLAGGTGGYEQAVFRQAVSAGAVVLGVIWWLISVLSLVVSPSSINKTEFCPACGGAVPSERYDDCPYCGRKI